LETKTVTLAAGRSETVTFEITMKEEGTFNVEVAGLNGKFIVKESKLPWELYVGIATVLIASALLIHLSIRPHRELIFKTTRKR